MWFFFLCQKYRSVSGQDQVRASSRGEESSLHLEMKFPLIKEQQSGFGCDRSQGVA